jgi:hypothetical protein
MEVEKIKENKLLKKRLIADIPLEIHNDLKMLAATRNISVTMYILRILIPQIIRDKELL